MLLLAEHDGPLGLGGGVHLLRPIDGDRHRRRSRNDCLRDKRSLEHLIRIDRLIKKLATDFLAPRDQLVDMISATRPDAPPTRSPNRNGLTVLVASPRKH